MGITVDLKAPWLRENPRAFASLVSNLLENIVTVNRVTLATVPSIPKLYASGVVYKTEPDDADSFVDLMITLEKGHGDCAHLCTWRVAELRNAGEDAALNVEWRDNGPNVPRLYHIRVRRGQNAPARFKGRIEDPSRYLGMGRE